MTTEAKQSSDSVLHELQRPDLSHQPIDCIQTMFSAALLMGAFLMGMIITQISNKTDLSNIYANESQHKMGTEGIMALWTLGGFFPLGGCVGAYLAVYVQDKYGRKIGSIIFFSLMVIGNIFGWLSLLLSFALLVISRFITGMAAAGLMVVAICWMMERLPDRLVPYFKPLIQLFTNLGIIASQAFGIQDVFVYCNFLVFLMPMIFATLSLITCFFTGESVRWMLMKGHDVKLAEMELRKLRGAGYMQSEMDYLKDSTEMDMKKPKVTMKAFLCDKSLLPLIIVAMLLHVGQQLSGINVIVAFTEEIFKTISKSFRFYVIGILCLNAFFSTIVCPFVAKLPRRITLLASHALMMLGFLIYIILYVYDPNKSYVWLYFSALSTSLFGFQLGLGPLVWFIVFEMFPERAAGAAQGFCSSINWVANSVVFFLFPVISNALIYPHYCLIIFVITNAIGFLFVYFFVVETLNRPVDSVIAEYRRRWRAVIG